MLHHTGTKQLQIFFDKTCLISSAYKNRHHIKHIWIRQIIQFGIFCKTLSIKGSEKEWKSLWRNTKENDACEEYVRLIFYVLKFILFHSEF